MHTATSSIKPWLIRGVLAAVFLLPNVVTSAHILSYHFGKWMYGIAIMLVIVVAAIIETKKEQTTSLSPVYIALIAWSIMHVVWSFIGDLSIGLWGDALRLDGAWVWVLMTLWGIWFINWIRQNHTSGIYFVLRTLMVSGLIAGVAAIAVQFAPDAVQVRIGTEGLGGRIVGLFGSATYLGAFLMTSLFFSITLIIIEKNKVLRIFSAITTALLVWFMFEAQTRGALLGAILGVLAAAIAYYVSKNNQILWLKRAVLAGSIIIIAWVYSMAFIPRDTASTIITHPAGLAQSMGSKGGITTRFIFWDIALQGIREKPLIGWGTHMYERIFDAYYNPELFSFSPTETWAERAHNHLLEQTANMGLIGLLAYLALFITPVWSLSEEDEQQARVIKAMMWGLLIAVAGFNMFAFDTPSTMLHMVVAAALITQYTKQNKVVLTHRFVTIRPILVVLLVVVGWKLIYQPLNESHATHNALVAMQNGYSQLYAKEAAKALQSHTFVQRDTLKMLADQLINNSNNIDQQNLSVAVALLIPEIEAYNKTDNTFALRVREAQLKGIRAVLTGDKKDIDQAQASFEKALELSPQRQTAYMSMVEMNLITGNLDEAEKNVNVILKLSPKFAQAHLIKGMIASFSDKHKEAGESYAQALALGIDLSTTIAPLELILRGLEENNNYDVIIGYLSGLFANAPEHTINSGLNHFRLASAYLNVGRLAEARSEAATALQLDPTLEPQVKEMIRVITQTP